MYFLNFKWASKLNKIILKVNYTSIIRIHCSSVLKIPEKKNNNLLFLLNSVNSLASLYILNVNCTLYKINLKNITEHYLEHQVITKKICGLIHHIYLLSM